jgi:hypothetical protein
MFKHMLTAVLLLGSSTSFGMAGPTGAETGLEMHRVTSADRQPRFNPGDTVWVLGHGGSRNSAVIVRFSHVDSGGQDMYLIRYHYGDTVTCPDNILLPRCPACPGR